MVKATVRAMDAIQEFVATLGLPAVPRINRFLISGGSKRGWYASQAALSMWMRVTPRW